MSSCSLKARLVLTSNERKSLDAGEGAADGAGGVADAGAAGPAEDPFLDFGALRLAGAAGLFFAATFLLLAIAFLPEQNAKAHSEPSRARWLCWMLRQCSNKGSSAAMSN
jgi:hypothetical protein